VSREAPYDQYAAELLSALRTCIDDVKARNGWQPQDTIRLIFHVFKDLKDAEAQAVKTLVQSLTTEYAGVEFAFLHIVEDHDWMMYDLSSPGVGEGSKVKGKCVPVRGHAVPISRSQMLITTMGPRELKVATHGAPQPLLIQLHREPTFTDLDYLAVQAVEPHASEPAAQTLSRRDAPMAVGQRLSSKRPRTKQREACSKPTCSARSKSCEWPSRIFESTAADVS
jgi:hypothetical protein